MINNLPDNDEFKAYLISIFSKIVSLIKSPEETFISSNYMGNQLDCKGKTLKLLPIKRSTSKKEIQTDVSTGGIYLIIHTLTNFIYIGSAINFSARLNQHLMNSTRPLRGGKNKFYVYVKTNGGWSNFYWIPLVETPNYILEFVNLNPTYKLSLNQLYILRSFTQFQILLYEQSYISYFKPQLNTSKTVVFPFSNWSPKYEAKLSGAVEIQVYDNKNRLIIEFLSKYKAASGLGITNTTLRRYSNTHKYIYSPFLDLDIRIAEKNDPMNKRVKKYDNMTQLPEISGLNLYSLEIGVLVALLEDKVTVFGTFKSPGEAALILDQKKDSRYISRYINLERTVTVGPDKIPVFFIMNPNYKKNSSLRKAPKSAHNLKAIVMVDTLTGVATKYSSVKELLIVLGLKSTYSTSIVKRYMNPIKLYKGRYEFHYEKDYYSRSGDKLI